VYEGGKGGETDREKIKIRVHGVGGKRRVTVLRVGMRRGRRGGRAKGGEIERGRKTERERERETERDMNEIHVHRVVG